jgi:zinc protease
MGHAMFAAWTTGVRREVLPNGLTLLVQRDSSAPVAAVVTHIKAGFFDEPDHWVGISHVLEHMFFKGTPTRGVGQIARETKAAGGYLNAHTSYDHTTYFVVLPAERLAEAVAIQADALRHPLLDPGELARELQVIIQEARRKLDTPGAVVQETLHAVMFDRHRMRRWRIGSEETLARFTRDEVLAYYRSRYVPARTIVAIAGDVDEETALALGREAYGDWPAAPGAVDRSPEEPPRREVRARTLRGDVTAGEIAFGWRGVPPLHPDAIPLDVAAAILGSGRGSWLYRKLRESGRALSISASHFAPTELGVFSIGARFEPERLIEVVEGVAACTGRLALAGPALEDLARARTLLATRWSRRLEEADGRAMALAAAEALESYRLVDRDFELLAAVEPEDVRRVAACYLDPEAVSACVFLPQGAGPDLTAERLAREFAVARLQAPDKSPTAPPLPPAPRRATGRDSAGVRHTALPAFDLLVRRKPGVPLVTLGVYLPRFCFDPPDRAGISALAIRTAVRGAGDLDSADLAFAFERLGGAVASTVSADWLGLGTTVLSAHLAEAAALLELVLDRPRYETASTEAERAVLVSEARQVTDDMFRYPFQLAFAEAYGDTGYGIPATGLAETLARLTVADVRGWQEAVLRTPRGVVLAVGDVDPGAASDVLAGIFSRHQPRPPLPMVEPVPWAVSGAPRSRVALREKAQTAIAFVFPGPSRRDPRRYAAEIWAAVAGGLGGRLFEALRDRRSLAYSVVASSWQRARGGALVTYIATAPEREGEAREAMLAELRRFATEPVSPEELRRAAEYLAGQVAVSRQSGAAVLGEILDAWLAGEGLAELEDPAARYRAVTGEEVQAAVAGLLASDYAEGVVRGSASRTD